MAVRQLLVTITLALAAAFSAVGQNPATANLSGTWVFNAAKSKLAKFMKVESETVVVTPSASTIEFRFTTNGISFEARGIHHRRKGALSERHRVQSDPHS